MNIQFVIMRESYGSRVYVLEVNPRASRTIPFISKVTGVPMVRIATKVLAGISLREQGYQTGLWRRRNLVGVKAPVFSMSKLTGVDTYLGPEMKSTGEVMGIDYTFEAALTKALMAAGLMLPRQRNPASEHRRPGQGRGSAHHQKAGRSGYKLLATEGTAAMIESEGHAREADHQEAGRGSSQRAGCDQGWPG